VRILVADDDPIGRRLLEKTLGTSGHEVVAVPDGTEAWHVLSAPEPPVLAILDWMMPGLTGIELCEKVRQAKRPVEPYLIVLTSRGATADVVTALQAGASDYITKPFEIEELRARIAVGERIVTLQQQLSERVRALEEAFAHVHQLQGLIPICAWCRQVRNDSNFWEQVDSYLAKRSALQFTHGICPACRDKEVTARATSGRPRRA
jgi:sigma-B regulation protein RsbU (phosphoserine phosphatase)